MSNPARAARALIVRAISTLRSIAGASNDDEVRDELQTHLTLEIEENMRRGMSADAARRAALLAAGGISNGVESVRDRQGLPWLENTVSDARFAVRTLRNKPGFTIAVLLTLALGIGANTAMFTIVNAVVLRPLPYPEPERILSISQTDGDRDAQVVDERTYFAWRESARSATLAAFSTTEAAITTSAGTEQLRGASIRDDYFTIFGTRPMLGRMFTDDEVAANGPKVIIVGEQFWRSHLGAVANVLGKSLEIDGVQSTIVGVMPASFAERRAQFWTPLRLRRGPNASFFVSVIARMRDGATIDGTTAELRTIAQRVVMPSVMARRNARIVVRTLHDRRFGERRKPLLILFGAVSVLLLIACANLANLNLARATSRRREVAVRLALGASRWRLVRVMLTESLLLSLAGAVFGIAFARLAVTYLVHLSPTSVGNADAIAIDTSVLLFTLAIAVATGIAFGLSPALAATRADINEVLLGSGGRAAGGRRFEIVRHSLVVAQLSTALLLLTMAGLVARSFWNVTSIDAGFRADHLVAVMTQLPLRSYEDDRAAAFYDQLLARVRALPGVRDAALADAAPLAGKRMNISQPDSGGQHRPGIDVMAIGPRYFETMDARRVNGRSFTDADRAGAQPVAILNALLARETFGASNPVGRLMTFGTEKRLVVGVFADVLQGDLERASTPLAYFPLAQEGVWPREKVMIRLRGAADGVESAIIDIVRSMDPAIPPPSFQSGEDILSEAAAPRQFTFLLLGIFATIAGSLAVIGLYGLLSHVVADRTREIGIRLALGADSARVMRLVLGQGFILTVIGAIVGLGASLLAVRTAQSLVFGVSIYDARTFAASVTLLVVVSVMAAWLPARRASSVDPIIALRAE
jgi:putative ABC transport system permease protein